MLDSSAWSKIPFYVVTGFLVAGLLFSTYQFATYQQAYKGKGWEIKYMKSQIEDLREANRQLEGAVNQYYGMAMQYRQILGRGIVIKKDTTMEIKKGTILIPPMPDKTSKRYAEEQ